MNEEMDIIRLRQALRNISFTTPSTDEPFIGLARAEKNLINFRQKPHGNKPPMSAVDYLDLDGYKRRQQCLDEAFGGADKEAGKAAQYSKAWAPAFIRIISKEKGTKEDELTDADRKEYIKEGTERLAAARFLLNADPDAVRDTLSDYARDYLSGHNMYPKDLTTAFTLVKSLKPRKKKQPPVPSDLGHSFNTVGDDDDDGTALVNAGNEKSSKKGTFPPCG